MMSTLSNDPQARLRQNIYLLLIVIGVGAMVGRILAVDAIDKTSVQEYRIARELRAKQADLEKQGVADPELEEALAAEEARLRERIYLRRPFLSANDRSRWCTVRALVEPEMRVEGAPYAIDKVVQEPNWDTIDMVKHDRRFNGQLEDLSLQPGGVIPDWDGRQRGGHLYSSKPPLLPTLMAAEYWVIHRLTSATLGTHPFEIGRFMLITINVIPMVVYFLLLGRLVERFGATDWGRLFVMAAAVFGTFLTTFAVTINNHLPAAVCAIITLSAAVPIWFDRQNRLRWFALAGFFGAFTVANELPAMALFAPLSIVLLWKAPRQTLLVYLPSALVVAAAFLGTNWIAHKSLLPAYAHRGGGGSGDWYDYTYIRNGRVIESNWRDPQGIDKGETSFRAYAVNVTVGHHGIFSLTPIWLLSIAGGLMWIATKRVRQLRELSILIGGTSLVCLAFYLYEWKTYGNYGGMTSGLRWMFWFAPLWLLMMLPAVDALARRTWTRGLALLLLAMSVLSASYPTWNPWVHPWLMDFFYYMGWI
jgi:hypothetical protein